MLQHVACVDDGRRIDRDVSFVDVLNDAVFIDQEGGAIAKALLFVEDAVILHDGAFEIAEERESDSELFGEFFVGGNAVYTEAKNLGVGGFEFGNISLICLQFFRSTAGESEYVNCEYDVFLTFEIAQLVSLAVSGAKREVRSRVADLQVCLDRRRLLAQSRNADHTKQHEGH